MSGNGEKSDMYPAKLSPFLAPIPDIHRPSATEVMWLGPVISKLRQVEVPSWSWIG